MTFALAQYPHKSSFRLEHQVQIVITSQVKVQCAISRESIPETEVFISVTFDFQF